MAIETWLTFIVAAMALCFTPGPTVLLVMGQALSHGRKSVLPLVAGVLAGDVIAMSLSLLGVGALLATSAELFTVLKWLGAGYLVYLGIKTWRSKPVEHQSAVTAQMSGRKVFRESLIVTALNPKGIIFFMAFFPIFIDSSAAVLPQMLTLGVSFLMVSASSALSYSLFSGYLRSRVMSGTFLSRFNQISGGLLVSAGALTATVQK